MKILLLLIVCSLYLFSSNRDNLPFDVTKLNNYNAKSDLKGSIGIIKNQVWIYSKSLSREQLENKILNLCEFQIISFDKLYGLLIQFDETNKEHLKIIEKIKYLKGIDDVFNRVYEGKNSFELNKLKK